MDKSPLVHYMLILKAFCSGKLKFVVKDKCYICLLDWTRHVRCFKFQPNMGKAAILVTWQTIN